jgi:dTDP-4-dehydrorhamnose 3,5-epimerase-like enzyme
MSRESVESGDTAAILGDVREVAFADVGDDRGWLTAAERGTHVPFPIERVFWVHRVAPGVPRGAHAHRDTDQVICAVAGSLTLAVSDGTKWRRFDLDDPSRGVYVPRMLWIDLLDFTEGTVCLVLANTIYDQSRSLRTWADYVAARRLPPETPRSAPSGEHASGGDDLG